MIRYYLDTEFNGFGGYLMSLGIVCEDGRTFYVVNPDVWTDPDSIVPWVKENVVPHMLSVPKDVKVMSAYVSAWGDMISEFIYGHGTPQIIADWPSDIADFCNLLLYPHRPGYAVEMGNQTHLTILRHIDVYPTDLPGAVQHNAIWDALALKHFVELSER